MEGIPAPDVADYKRRKEIELGLSAGSISQPQAKRPKVENRALTEEELRAQLEAHKALMGGNDSASAPAAADSSNGAVYGAPPQAYSAPPTSAMQLPPPGISPPPMGFPPGPPPFLSGGPPPLGAFPGQPPFPGMPGMPGMPGFPGYAHLSSISKTITLTLSILVHPQDSQCHLSLRLPACSLRECFLHLA